MPSNSSKYYDRYYEKKFKEINNLDYEENFYERVPGSYYAGVVSILEKMMQGNSKPAVLEIGVGTGAMLHWFRHRGVSPRAIEISQYVVDSLAAKGFDIRRVDINENPIPFEDGAFDIVLSLDVIEHIVDPMFFMSEIARTLARDGTAIISTPNARTVKRIFQLLITGRFPWTSDEGDGWDCGHLHYFTTRDIADLGRLNGLETIQCKGSTVFSHTTKGRLKQLLFSLLPANVQREFFSGTFFSVLRKASDQ